LGATVWCEVEDDEDESGFGLALLALLVLLLALLALLALLSLLLSLLSLLQRTPRVLQFAHGTLSSHLTR
jgi:hypothetical protein